MYHNVQFFISGINSVTTGPIQNRYVEKLAIYYHDENGASIFDSFTSNQSLVPVSFNFPISGVTLSLFDDENNNSGTSVMSVNLSSISTCYTACAEVLNVVDIIPTKIYQANETIMSNGTIQNSENVDFKAGSFVELNSKFSVNEDSNFSATIEACE